MSLFNTAMAANDAFPPEAMERDGPGEVALRQLRHHTKNALQRLLAEVTNCTGLRATSAGRVLAADLERRILLSATVSDALFGLVRAPRPLATRLEALAGSLVELMSDGNQVIGVTIDVEGERFVRPEQADVLLRVANELVGNAVKHGMHVRMVGQVALSVRVEPGANLNSGVVMTVADDGWGMDLRVNGGEVQGELVQGGEGLRLAQIMAAEEGGTVTLARQRGWTVATLSLPGAGPEGWA